MFKLPFQRLRMRKNQPKARSRNLIKKRSPQFRAAGRISAWLTRPSKNLFPLQTAIRSSKKGKEKLLSAPM